MFAGVPAPEDRSLPGIHIRRTGDRVVQFLPGGLTSAVLLKVTFEGKDYLPQAHRAAPLGEAVRKWVGEEGELEPGSYSVPPHAHMLLGGWYVSMSRLRWNVCTLVPLVLLNIHLGRGVGPTDFHGLLTGLEHVIRRLEYEELVTVLRVRDQSRGVGKADPETLGIGLSPSDREVALDLCERLRVDGVLAGDAKNGYRLAP